MVVPRRKRGSIIRKVRETICVADERLFGGMARASVGNNKYMGYCRRVGLGVRDGAGVSAGSYNLIDELSHEVNFAVGY